MKQAFLLLALGTLLTCRAFAQSTPPANSAPAGGPPPDASMGMSPVTQDDIAELKKAQSAAIADPSIAKDITDLKEREQALQERGKALEAKVRAAMIKADPKVEPILAKIDAARRYQQMQSAPPPSGNPPPMPPPPATK